ncbi:UNVERIFIED_CONTAM: hypothetical protein Slati_2734600 [Sesamum latifolium]|uniref:Uncharacterized protein n=1 Tax=Sesamum latifolium TaxID=2727402 RepID=A0AAW2VY67_9LAMI
MCYIRFYDRNISPCSFFDSLIGSSTSYTWRSLWGTPDLLVVGLRWKVGDGTLILIIGHPWIPRPISFQPICRPNSLSPKSRVSALLTVDKAWNIDLIKAEFCQSDADSILEIKLTDGECDSLVWHFDNQGRCSVWSAYSLALHLKEVRSRRTTMERLRSHGVQLSDGCGICGLGTQTRRTSFGMFIGGWGAGNGTISLPSVSQSEKHETRGCLKEGIWTLRKSSSRLSELLTGFGVL